MDKTISFLVIALWKFPESILYQVLFYLPKHRLELLNKLCYRVHKARFKRRSRGKIPKLLDGGELSRLFLGFRTEKYRVLFKVMYIQALRPSEATSFRIERIYPERGTAEIYDCKKDFWTEIIMHPKAMSLLRIWAEDNEDRITEKEGWIFFGERTKRLSVYVARNHFYKARKRANLPEWCCPYVLRHTRLNQLYDATKDLRLVAEFGRHTADTCFRYYMHANKEELKKAVCTMPVRFK